MGFRVAVAGATGNVGRKILDILAERRFPADEITLLASPRSVGKEIAFGGLMLTSAGLEEHDFVGADIALFAAGSEVSWRHAPRVAEAGCVVIDNSSLYGYDEDVLLVVSEVNASALAGYRARNIVANPNCSTMQMVLALKPLHDRARIRRVIVATYQSVSGAGKAPMDKLRAQAAVALDGHPPETGSGGVPIAFNVVPHIDVFLEDGSTREEWKMVAETRRILDPAIEVVAICVRVLVFVGHVEVVNIEFESPLGVEEARELLAAAPGVELLDRREGGRLCHSPRLCREGRGFRESGSQGSDGGARDQPAVYFGQSPQGCSAECGADCGTTGTGSPVQLGAAFWEHQNWENKARRII